MILPTFSGVVLALSTTGTPSQDTTSTFDFGGLAEGALAGRGISSREGGTTFEEFLARDEFARIGLGSFDLWIPAAALGDAARADEFRSACLTLLDVEERWHAWLDPSTSEESAAATDRRALQEWIKGWSKGELARARSGGALFDLLKSKERVVEAAHRLVDLSVYDEATVQAVGNRNQIVFAPTRRDFLELVSIAGLLHPGDRDALWDPRNLERASAWRGWCQICCFENVNRPVDPSNPFEGIAMEARSPTSFEQFVADRGAAILLRKEFWSQGTHFFEESLSTTLVLDVVGRNNLHGGDWKMEYSWSGETTQPYERFVPGGNPAGGTLPTRKAGLGFVTSTETEISRYRKNEGEGYFLKPLREGQKAGQKLVRKDKDHPLREDSRAHFELFSLETHESFAVTAPFLGPFAEGKALPPDEFLDDYEDYFRAYRSGFLHWLREEGGGDPQASAERFGRLIAGQASREPSKAFHQVVEDVYGVPLSHSSGGVDSLEWRFLAFLANGR